MGKRLEKVLHKRGTEMSNKKWKEAHYHYSSGEDKIEPYKITLYAHRLSKIKKTGM